jgi:Phage integrase SAM-like domain
MKITAPKTTGRSVPIKETITSIGGGYPNKLVIFKIPASPYWYVRYYTQNRILKKSTKTEDKRIATTFAKKFYEDILLKERNLLPVGQSPSFERVARELLIEQEQLIQRGERSSKLNINDKQKLEKDILPYFKGMHVKEVSYKHLDNFVTLLKQRELKAPTINNHLSLIHKILALAERENLIDKLPTFPRIKKKDSPRGWFNNDEYKLLLQSQMRCDFSSHSWSTHS